MSDWEKEEYYQNKEFTPYGLDGSYTPCSNLKILPLIKKNYQWLYYITQRGWSFSWESFYKEVLSSLLVSIILTVMGYGLYSGTQAMHSHGYTADFWMASFSIFTSLVYLTIAVLLCRTDKLTWLLALFVVGGAVVPFISITWTFDTLTFADNTGMRILSNISDTYHYYLLVIALVFLASSIEIIRKIYRKYHKPTLADYFTQLIKDGKEGDPVNFKPEILEAFIKIHDPIVKKVKKRHSITSNELRESFQSSQLEKPDTPLNKQVSYREKINGNLEPLTQHIVEPMSVFADKQSVRNTSWKQQEKSVLTLGKYKVEEMDLFGIVGKKGILVPNNHQPPIDKNNSHSHPALMLDCNLIPANLRILGDKEILGKVSPKESFVNNQDQLAQERELKSGRVHKDSSDEIVPILTPIKGSKEETELSQAITPRYSEPELHFPPPQNKNKEFKQEFKFRLLSQKHENL